MFAAIAAACISQASAQNYATKLESTQVYYLTNDTCAFQKEMVEDEETGDEVEQTVETYWMGSSLSAAYKALNLPIQGVSSTKCNYKVRTRKNYTDEETGFFMPSGFYRGIFVDETMDLTGYDKNENYMVGFQNLKSVVLYFAPIPTAWVQDGPVSHQDYPTGRVQARYMSLESSGTEAGGTAISNQAYREIHINEKADPLGDDYRNIKGTNLCHFQRDAEDPRNITIDHVYKMKFNLDNKLDGKDYEDLFASDSGDDWIVFDGVKKSEFVNFICEDDTYEGEMDYYFADVTTTNPYTKNESPNSSATGFNCYDNKWGSKIAWDVNTIIQVQLKKRLYLMGYALICADEDPDVQFVNMHDGKNADWDGFGMAYGTYAPEIDYVPEENSISTIENKQTLSVRQYNLAGQRSNTAQGLQIKNNKVIFCK